MSIHHLRATALCALSGILAAQTGPTLELPAVIPVHTAPDDPAGGAYGLWAAGRGYKVSFHDGLSFHPACATRADQAFTWRTAAVRRGAADLAVPAAVPRLRWSDTRVELDHGAVVERYDVRALDRRAVRRHDAALERPRGGRHREAQLLHLAVGERQLLDD